MPKMKLDDFGVWIHAYAPRKLTKTREMGPAYRRIAERRALVRRSYFIIRDDPDQHSKVLSFARALGGKTDLTDDLLEDARKIIADHGHNILQ